MADDELPPWLHQVDDDVITISVRLVPRASRAQVIGTHGDDLRISVTAPPEDGKANKALVSLLAKTLGVARSRVELASGHASRSKVVAIAGLDAAEVRRIMDQSQT